MMAMNTDETRLLMEKVKKLFPNKTKISEYYNTHIVNEVQGMPTKVSYGADYIYNKTVPKLQAAPYTTLEKQMILAIRLHPITGPGDSATHNTMDDKDLIADIRENNIKTVADAVKMAVNYEDMHDERALNARWGEDDDDELQASDNLKTSKKSYSKRDLMELINFVQSVFPTDTGEK